METLERSTSLESIPKDLLLKLKQFRNTSVDFRRSREDGEVETCLQGNDSVTLSPKSTISDDVFFKYPKRTVDYDDSDEKRSQCSYSESRDTRLPSPVPGRSRDSRLPSPGPDRNNFSIYGDNSDWMLAERTKSRSPPVSPSHAQSVSPSHVRPVSPSHYHSNSFSPISDKSRVLLERTPVKTIHCHPSFSQNIDQTMNGSPLKSSPIPVLNPEYGVGGGLQDRSPLAVHQDRLSPRRSPMLPVMMERPFRGNQSASPYIREPAVDPRGTGLTPEYHRAMFMEELSKRGARKQLSFDTGSRPYLPPAAEGYGDVMYPPRRVRYRASSDSDLIEAEERFDDDDSRLINKFLSHLNQRKRKASERFDCDYEDDAVIQAKRKRKELEKRMNMNYLKQLEADVSMLNSKLSKTEPELRPDNCSCAVMEKQFLNMAENAYKNIRRQDMTSDGFVQFRKELNDTNIILKESLEILQNMKEFCEHRTLLRD